MTTLDFTPKPAFTGPGGPVGFLELEITRECQARCQHCYSNSGPAAGSGAMTAGDWRAVIAQAGAHPDITTVQFIGGEPTQHPEFAGLVRHALDVGLGVAIYTNLIEVTPALWELYEDDRVRLSASWYSADRAEHDRILGYPGAYVATWANLRSAVRRGIEVKVGIVRVLADQDVDGAVAQLTEIGITDYNIDDARPVGRALGRGQATTVDDLCGMCGRGRAAIDTNGQLMPCVLGRAFTAGNVRDTPLAELLAGERWAQIVAAIPGKADVCNPADSNDCDPSR
ncbi:radical SAM/SPASM domain-containing protein [Actinomadura harenae]|uniref:Radical SAM protein n=1 Tax=Actinomadura harenae TaxID=2483351 RepID=A0A3M2LQU7_9ACTN|nr:radical SAM protein [Actinomadura harenae]RMI39864.1 radical SAM protein [Actinomadura harenae]